MKKGMSFSGITGKVIVGDEEFSVEFEAVDCFVSNDGIGGYEYFGYKGNDRGQDYVEEFEIGKLVVRSEEGNEITDPGIIESVRSRMEQSDEISEAVNHAFREFANEVQED